MAYLADHAAKYMYAYVGCRTTKERNARGRGISVYRIEQERGTWELIQLVKTKQENPSFLAFDRSKTYLYTIHGDFSEVSAYKINKQNGHLEFINQQSTEGKNPVHLIADPSNRFLIVANYATSSLVSLPIQGDEGLGPVVGRVDLQGPPGPHRTQQRSSHPHHTFYDPKDNHLFVPDKGVDKIFSFCLSAGDGSFIPGDHPDTVAREGAAPRHIVFHKRKPLAYVANELDSSITAYQYDAETGKLTPLQIVPSIPETFTGNNTAAEIMLGVSGKFLYVSNRGHDSVAVFSINEENGFLAPIQWQNSLGKGPRFFNLDPYGRYLYAANEASDTIVSFEIHPHEGTLKPFGPIIKSGSPVCIEFLLA